MFSGMINIAIIVELIGTAVTAVAAVILRVVRTATSAIAILEEIHVLQQSLVDDHVGLLDVAAHLDRLHWIHSIMNLSGQNHDP